MGKENKLTFWNHIINIYNKNPPQKDEMMMKTKPCIE